MSKKLAAALIVLLPVAGASLAQSGTQEVLTGDTSLLARTSAADAVFVRRLLMSSIGTNNDSLHDIFDGVFEYDARDVKQRLGSMSNMLLAFPHLYRVAPDTWSQEEEENNPGLVTQSKPAVWENWEDFRKLAEQASDKALEASLASTEEQQKALTDELEGMCESCHATYRRDFVTLELEDVLAE